MVQKLSVTDPPLLEYRKHKGVALTRDGEMVALETIRHHRLIEMFLLETLGYRWDEVHEEAEQLEHVISEEFEERVAHFLGNPTHDPHGDPIPTRDLKLPPSSGIQLSELRPGDAAKVIRVRDDDPELLRHLSSLGLRPFARVQVVSYSPFDDNLTLKIEGRTEPSVLGKMITSLVYIEME